MTLIDAAMTSEGHEQDSCELELKTTLRGVILAKFQTVAAAQGKPLAAPLTDDLVLLESGLDSLCFAIIVATLEDELGFDPFTEAEDVYFPVTLGDFVRFYERAR
jgi:acyl carrier protein